MSLEQAILCVTNLSKRIGLSSVLDDVSFSVYSGETYGLIGKSGAGKSTLLQLLMGMLPIDRGEIFYQGLSLSSLKGAALRRLRRSIGLVVQQYPLFSSRTALENVRYPMEIANQQGNPLELLSWVGLAEYGCRYPAELSGGQRQRVAIARALALNPALFILDEPTSALDPESTESLLALLRTLQRELRKTFVIITHEMDVIKQLCHRVAVLDRGVIVEEGRTLDICTHPTHAVTKVFLSHSAHPNPAYSYPDRKQARRFLLRFPPSIVGKGLISQVVKEFDVQANILLGSIDVLLEGAVGNLLVELAGDLQPVQQALHFLGQAGILIEEIDL